MVPIAPSYTCVRPSAIRSRRPVIWRDASVLDTSSLIPQIRTQPAFHLSDAHSLPTGVVLDLIPSDLPQAEVAGFRSPEVVAAHRGGRQHRKRLSQPDTGSFLCAQKVEQGPLLRVIGTSRVPGCRADPLVLLSDDCQPIERFISRVAPELLSHSGVQS